jgi:hypothetical protein
MLAASFALFAQGDDFPVKSQDHSSVPDIRQIVESSMAATHRHWQARLGHQDGADARRRWDLEAGTRRSASDRENSFVKSLVIDRVLTYSEYRLPQAGVPGIRDPVIP